MKYRNIIICVLLAVLLVFGTAACADIAEPGDDFYYLDEAEVLSEQTEGEIYFCNKLLEEACGAQIVIAAVENTGNYAIDDYAYEMFNEWQIGDKKENNGFLLLMAIEDEDYYAIAGSGMDIKFSSGVIGNYLDKYLEPYFAQAEYDKGAKVFFEAAFERIADIYGADITVQNGISAYRDFSEDAVKETEKVYSASSEIQKQSSLNLILIIIGLVILLSILSKKRNRNRRYSNASGNSFWIPFLLGRMTSGNRRRTVINPVNHIFRQNTPFDNCMYRNHFTRSNHSTNHNSSFGGTGFGQSRSSGFGSSRNSGFGGGRTGGFGGARGGGGGTRGGGAGRGRR